MKQPTNCRPEVENQEIYPFNPSLEKLISKLKHDVLTIRYHSEISGQDESVRGTLIGYWHDFGHPYRYVPRQTFLPLFDMTLRRWTTLRTDSILYDSPKDLKDFKDLQAFKDPKDTIIIHCSATRPGQDVGAAEIDRWHRQRGFDGIGYHYVVRLDGTIEEGRPYHREGAHALGWNKRAVGICYIGGLDNRKRPCDTRTIQQREALKTLILRLKKEHPGLVRILGHRDVARKDCPCFDAAGEYSSLRS